MKQSQLASVANHLTCVCSANEICLVSHEQDRYTKGEIRKLNKTKIKINKSPTNNWFPVGFWFEISPGSVEIDKKKTWKKTNLKWMELEVVVSFRHLFATAVFNTRKLFLIKLSDIAWCIFCHRTKLYYLQPVVTRHLIQTFNQKPTQKTHKLWDKGTGSTNCSLGLGLMLHHSVMLNLSCEAESRR